MKYFIFVIIILSILLSACSKENFGPGQFDDLANCLTSNGATMYGTEWCPHCKNQKQMFGTSFKYINYVDCDKYMNECINAGVEGYPTWKINGTNYPGTQSLYVLAEKSGCLNELLNTS
ncbi:MAG: hypothetical protein KatS3mg002_0547 [Candidatus Woesearchaeota archaeon]|nr:MAG: hypothetical protein KatS3mg002_0547 [Candidatus Woesearchaeota archaeon]